MQKKWYKNYFKYKKKEEKFKKELTESTKYIEWLENYTQNKNYFTTMLLDNVKNMSSEDEKNIAFIETIFSLAEDYYKDNFLRPKIDDYITTCYFKHNNICYSVGWHSKKEEKYYFCKRLDNKIENAIEFNNIVNNIPLPETVLLNKKLEELIEAINDIADDNVDKCFVNREVSKVYRKIE